MAAGSRMLGDADRWGIAPCVHLAPPVCMLSATPPVAMRNAVTAQFRYAECGDAASQQGTHW